MYCSLSASRSVRADDSDRTTTLYDIAGMASQPLTPVFIFSSPRSGSTLLQRILAAHPDVATASEPWILLPLLMARRTGGTYAVYRHEDAVHAIQEFAENLPNGIAAFDEATRSFAMELYRLNAGSEARYFVDKTPRYHLIAHEIVHLFPEAKLIFLWRNPISIIGSILRTWGRGRWNLFRYHIDLESGPRNLIETYRAHGESAIAIRYEDLIQHPEAASKQLFDYLGLDYRPEVLEGFADVKLEGSMGDQTGIRHGPTISSASLDAWTALLDSPLRKLWVRGYLRRLGDDTIKTMGYEPRSLFESLDNVPNRFGTVLPDIARMVYGIAYVGFDSLVEWRSKRYLTNSGREWLTPPSCIPEHERSE